MTLRRLVSFLANERTLDRAATAATVGSAVADVATTVEITGGGILLAREIKRTVDALDQRAPAHEADILLRRGRLR